jgi:hypothetical protein
MLKSSTGIGPSYVLKWKCGREDCILVAWNDVQEARQYTFEYHKRTANSLTAEQLSSSQEICSMEFSVAALGTFYNDAL